MNQKPDRRRFLKQAALAGLTVGAGRSGIPETRASETPGASPSNSREYGVPARFENTVRRPETGGSSWYDPRGSGKGMETSMTPLQDLTGIITPAGLHFDTTKGSPPPDIDPRQYRLLIHGMVDRPLSFTLGDLKGLPSVSRIHYIECAGNGGQGQGRETVQLAWGRTGCSEWTGVLLSVLLQEAGVREGAKWILAEGSEAAKHIRSIPLTKAMDDVLVAYGQNGEAVRPEQGYPVRLVLPGWIGNINVKWLRRIKVVDQPYMSRWESPGYARLRPDGTARWFIFEVPPKSVITFPSGGQQLPGRGFYEIRGLAWSGAGAVRRVEVSTDHGRNWQDAQLQEPVLRFAHTRFRLPWQWDGNEAVLQSRCTDERGQVQPTLAEYSKLWGVSLDFFQSGPVLRAPSEASAEAVPSLCFNAIQSWKVMREGSVKNALYD